MLKSMVFLMCMTLISWGASWLACCDAAGPKPGSVKRLRATGVQRVAHAGGAVNGQTYTNSIEALDINYQAGFRWFEMDFVWTRDRELVSLHDWKDSCERLFDTKLSQAPSFAEFLELRQRSDLRIPTLNELAAWFSAHEDAVMITDVKADNTAALKLIAEAWTHHQTRVIPQIYHPREHQPVQALGYEQQIWTLYRYGYKTRKISHELQTMTVMAVTMPVDFARLGLAAQLALEGIPTYAHTVNRRDQLEDLTTLYAVTGVYTDKLVP